MKKFLLSMVAVVVIALGTAVPAQAQFHFGPKVGMNVSSLKFNSDIVDKSNLAGFTGGVMCEFTVPVLGLGFDASVLYVHRNSKYLVSTNNPNDLDETTNATAKTDYIDIPVNFKWKIGLPVVSKIIVPFVTTGPDFAFLCNKQIIENAVNMKNFDFAWNFGLGIQILGKVQVAASYGLGLTKALNYIAPINNNGANIDGKNRYWTVTAAYLF